MDSWPAVLGIAYLVILIAGVVWSVATRQQPRRRNIALATTVLATPACFIGLLLAVVRFGLEPPSLSELQRGFIAKRTDLETIVRMSDEDRAFSRIAPDFFYRAYGGEARGPGVGLPESRLSAYRNIYARSGAKRGLNRDGAGDVFIIVDSAGLLNRGHASGYLYCSTDGPINAFRFQPCVLGQDKGERKYDPRTREEAYSFQRLDDRWYAYDEGPG